MNGADRFLYLVLKTSLVLTLAGTPALAQSVNGACLYALDPTAQQAFYISGNATITTNCSIVDESSSSAAFEMGGTDTLYLGNHAQVGVVGGWQLNGQSMIDTISNQQVQPVSITNPGDPLASLAAPTQGAIVSSAPVSYSSSNPPPNNTLSPGVYCGGLAIANTGGAQFTMSPGTYIIAGGGFNITSSAIVEGTGVTVYNTSSAGWGCSGTYGYTPITINGQASLNLSAPTSGTLAGIVLFGDRNGCASPGTCQDNINGKATATFNGVLYLKSDQLLFNGSSASGGCMAAVADKITINGDTYSGGNGCFLNPISISISPTSVGLYGGQTQQFTATVTNTYFTNVTWSISPAGLGSIDQSGNYTAPSLIGTQQTVTVTATSQADTTKSASATVTLFPPMTISISPLTATLYAGQQQTFSATVTNTFNSAVTWSISPAGTGSISASGVYTAPASISAQQAVTVSATSQANPSLSASATVTLMPPIIVSVSPTTAALSGGQTQQFMASVSNTSNQAVTWSIAAGGTGTISASGLYTAPTGISGQQTVTVIATSQADPTKSATAVVSVQPSSVGQALTLTASNVPPYVVGTSQQFTAVLKNRDGSPLSGVSVSFTVTGVNNATGTGTTDANGAASFAYAGTISGNDTVLATSIAQGAQVTSNPLLAGWVVPAHPISTTTVLGRFYPLYAPCCAFRFLPFHS
jgi:hypothetical protein